VAFVALQNLALNRQFRQEQVHRPKRGRLSSAVRGAARRSKLWLWGCRFILKPPRGTDCKGQTNERKREIRFFERHQ